MGADERGSKGKNLPLINTDDTDRVKSEDRKQKLSNKKGRHYCRPTSGGEEREPTLIAVFVLLASSCSCVPAGVAGVPA